MKPERLAEIRDNDKLVHRLHGSGWDDHATDAEMDRADLLAAYDDLRAERDTLIDEVKTLQEDLEEFGEAQKTWLQFRRERDALKAELAKVIEQRDIRRRDCDDLAAESHERLQRAQKAEAELAEARAAIERVEERIAGVEAYCSANLLDPPRWIAGVRSDLAALDAPQRPEDTRERPKLITGNGTRRDPHAIGLIHEDPEDTREETGP